MGTDAGKVGLMKKSTYETRDAASNWERDWDAVLALSSTLFLDDVIHCCSGPLLKMESAPNV